ncbi:MAG: hypothetical protein Q4B26_08395 [Eubacteriales bacterium]|nr:hypothetical protein [Eubacteriales bacterium]
MDNLFKIYDTYNLRVRISVGFIVMAPLILSIYLLIPGTRDISFTAILLLIAFGMCNLMISLSRHLGRKALNKCFTGLLPAQQMLLPNDKSLDNITKKRYHKFLSSKVKNLTFAKDAENLTSSCSSAVNWLISQTRDANKFPLIKEESINFGFVKNLYGLKPIGVVISLFLTVVEGAALIVKFKYGLDMVEYPTIIAATTISLAFFLLWICTINKALVIDSGKKYARALLSACDSEIFNS